MSKDDLPVILYKLLAYIYECMKQEVEPTVEQARRLCEANETMFDAAVEAAIDNELVKGVERNLYYSGSSITFRGAKLTLEGSTYLIENSTMTKAKKVAGEAFQIVLGQVIATAAKLTSM